jgi:hypothetical protein
MGRGEGEDPKELKRRITDLEAALEEARKNTVTQADMWWKNAVFLSPVERACFSMLMYENRTVDQTLEIVRREYNSNATANGILAVIRSSFAKNHVLTTSPLDNRPTSDEPLSRHRFEPIKSTPDLAALKLQAYYDDVAAIHEITPNGAEPIDRLEALIKLNSLVTLINSGVVNSHRHISHVITSLGGIIEARADFDPEIAAAAVNVANAISQKQAEFIDYRPPTKES